MSTSGIVYRPRRLRTTPRMRRLAAETRLHAADLVLPLFVKEGLTEPAPISSMPGQVQHTEATLADAVAAAARAGVGGVMLFGIPAERDGRGTAGDDPDGILQRGIRAARAAVTAVEAETGRPGPVVMADTCLDEFTDHGHCGVLTPEGVVDNDSTLERYATMAVAQAKAGAEVVSPSGMMDGQVAVIRDALDDAGFEDVSILAYSAKYASAFYGPFREAVDSALQGDRRTYQMDAANSREGLREADLDLAEGADMVMVKPAGTSLDVLRGVADRADVPVAAYQVSGEYAMIEAAAANGWIDRRGAVLESVLAIKRAGADVILTYWAHEIADWLA
ncbi:MULTISPECIES: porphobilinogen synthase [unclassified Isoptericola]|uniref:porphobilinogen synthase n=1 Tax=unclassified Isoptericola TaxID=2623355 RepID=UPI0027141F8A|nr:MULTISPECIES: porphobilinogen synthase [unclassified Isoptericola]MDO8145754.1 porphobilinogen synthase [Isoptericola sp. 178]MDO8147905.1 porphobilinogen synthase [Isoptericola sp. b515]